MNNGVPCPKGKDLIQADVFCSKTCRKCGHWHSNRDTGWACCDLQDTTNLEALAKEATANDK